MKFKSESFWGFQKKSNEIIELNKIEQIRLDPI